MEKEIHKYDEEIKVEYISMYGTFANLTRECDAKVVAIKGCGGVGAYIAC